MTSPSPLIISRDPAPVELDGWYCPTLETLVSAFPHSEPARDWVVGDLSLGAWRGHWVAREFCRQLRLAPGGRAPNLRPARKSSGAKLSYADTIGSLVDAEASGNRTIREALEVATQITAFAQMSKPRTFIVIAPRFALSWETEDLTFLRFLSQGLRETESRLALVCADAAPPMIPEDWIVRWRNAPPSSIRFRHVGLHALIPGVIDDSLSSLFRLKESATEDSCLLLAEGCRLVPLECRQAPDDVAHGAYERLAAAATSCGWLKAYAQYYSEDARVDLGLLALEAWNRFEEGAADVAFRLLKRALGCARAPAERSAIQGQMQGMLIALHRFEEAAAMPDPIPFIPTQHRAFSYQSKGWGMVMTGRAQEAESYFQRARELLREGGHSREYLYLLNISALNRLRLGDINGALALESEIEAALEEHQERDWQLEYLNSLNTARLHLRNDNLKAAEHYFRRAFATTFGVRSEGDAIFTNLTEARLYKAHGRFIEAFHCWLRLSLHWVSSLTPEALPHRVARTILSRAISATDILPEAISAAVARKLCEAAEQAGLAHLSQAALDNSAPNKLTPPSFINTRGLPQEGLATAFKCAVGRPGWSLLLTRTAIRPQFNGPHHIRLRQLLRGYLQQITPDSWNADVSTLAIDDRFGRELPVTIAELVETCLRLEIPRMIFEGTKFEFDEGARARLNRALKIQMASAIDRVVSNGAGSSVLFKRYLPPRTLSDTERRVLKHLDEEHPTVEKLVARFNSYTLTEVLQLLRQLESSRIIELSLPEDWHRMIDTK